MNILQISAIIVELIIAHCFIYLKINPKKFSNLTDMSIFAVTAIGITGDAIIFHGGCLLLYFEIIITLSLQIKDTIWKDT